MSDKPAVPDCQATCKKDTEAVDALVKLVRLLPKAKERKTSKFSSAIKAVMRRVQHFIGQYSVEDRRHMLSVFVSVSSFPGSVFLSGVLIVS